MFGIVFGLHGSPPPPPAQRFIARLCVNLGTPMVVFLTLSVLLASPSISAVWHHCISSTNATIPSPPFPTMPPVSITNCARWSATTDDVESPRPLLPGVRGQSKCCLCWSWSAAVFGVSAADTSSKIKRFARACVRWSHQPFPDMF